MKKNDDEQTVACPQGCTPSYRDAPPPKAPKALMSANAALAREVAGICAVVVALVLLGFGILQLALWNDARNERLEAPKRAAEAVRAREAEIALVRNIAAIEHSCPQVVVTSALEEGGVVIVYRAQLCGQTRTYRLVDKVWKDTTPLQPAGSPRTP
jgi:hypothetical protein